MGNFLRLDSLTRFLLLFTRPHDRLVSKGRLLFERRRLLLVLIDEHCLSITHLAHQSVEANTALMCETLLRRQVKLTNLTALLRTLIRYRWL